MVIDHYLPSSWQHHVPSSKSSPCSLVYGTMSYHLPCSLVNGTRELRVEVQRVAVAVQKGNAAAMIGMCMRTDNDNVYDFSYY